MDADPIALLEVFARAGAAERSAVRALPDETKRARTGRPGQYGLDIIADQAALGVLHEVDAMIVSEESGYSGNENADVTIVLDPVDGSSNCARNLTYYATSIAAIDREGLLCSLVVNQATGSRFAAVRGQGAFRDDVELKASSVEKVEDSIVALSGMPARMLPWSQYRALGCASLMLCDVAAGGLDGLIDSHPNLAPWDYLGGYLACVEAGAVVRDANGEALVTDDPKARRQLIAAGTMALCDLLMPGKTTPGSEA